MTNHITRLGKRDFETACRLVLSKVFNLIAVNVDGAGDGGTDFILTLMVVVLKLLIRLRHKKTILKIKRIRMRLKVFPG